MKITDADSFISSFTRTISDFFASDAVDQPAIDRCRAAPLSNSSDLRAMFAAHGGFISLYNSTLASMAAFKHRGRISSDAGSQADLMPSGT